MISLGLGLTACKKTSDDTNKQLEVDKALIENYLSENNLTAESTASGLYYIIENPGTGTQPTIDSEVTVRYSGKFLSGTVFDSGTASFPLSNVIKGWQEGIPLYKAGGKGTLIIPSGLAYGPNGSGPIPGNTVLLFDIYLISVK
jgi:FKBP-type peptidyl-prolyl cis-trans isomerase FkpA